MLVYFYSPVCKECNTITLEVNDAANKLNEYAIRIAKFNCEEEKEICDSYGVNKFPNFLYFINGKPYPYNGPLLSTGMSKWVLSKEKLVYQKIDESLNLEDLIQASRISLVYFGDISDKETNILQSASLSYSYIHFYETSLKKDYELFKITSPKLVLFKGDNKIPFDKDLEFKSLSDFLDKHKPAKIYEFNDESIKLIFEQKSTTFFYLRSEVEKKNYQLAIEKLADKYQETLLFVSTDLTHKGKNSSKLSQVLGISPSQQPLGVILEIRENFTKYRSPGNTYDELNEFISSFISGNLQAYYKSKPIPEGKNGDSKVVIVVGLNHQEIIEDKTKDILMLYCTERHPDCDEFSPIYEKIAIVYTQYGDFVTGKMDIVHNEAKGLKIPKLPLIVLYPKDKKEGIIYQGEMNMIGILSFVAQNIKQEKKIDL